MRCLHIIDQLCLRSGGQQAIPRKKEVVNVRALPYYLLLDAHARDTLTDVKKRGCRVPDVYWLVSYHIFFYSGRPGTRAPAATTGTLTETRRHGYFVSSISTFRHRQQLPPSQLERRSSIHGLVLISRSKQSDSKSYTVQLGFEISLSSLYKHLSIS